MHRTLVALFLMLPAAAHAQPAAAPKAPAAAAPPPTSTAPAGTAPAGAAAGQAAPAEGAQPAAVKVERGAGGKKIYRITQAIQIEGKIQKPEAFYVLQKSGINYDWQELKQDFIPKILDSVSKAPF
jgi:hypothetical protein